MRREKSGNNCEVCPNMWYDAISDKLQFAINSLFAVGILVSFSPTLTVIRDTPCKKSFMYLIRSFRPAHTSHPIESCDLNHSGGDMTQYFVPGMKTYDLPDDWDIPHFVNYLLLNRYDLPMNSCELMDFPNNYRIRRSQRWNENNPMLKPYFHAHFVCVDTKI